MIAQHREKSFGLICALPADDSHRMVQFRLQPQGDGWLATGSARRQHARCSGRCCTLQDAVTVLTSYYTKNSKTFLQVQPEPGHAIQMTWPRIRVGRLGLAAFTSAMAVPTLVIAAWHCNCKSLLMWLCMAFTSAVVLCSVRYSDPVKASYRRRCAFVGL